MFIIPERIKLHVTLGIFLRNLLCQTLTQETRVVTRDILRMPYNDMEYATIGIHPIDSDMVGIVWFT